MALIHTQQTLTTPPFDYFPVTPDDNTDLPKFAKSLYIGGNAGVVSVVKLNGGIEDVPVAGNGFYALFPCRRVRATGTTATQIWALAE